MDINDYDPPPRPHWTSFVTLTLLTIDTILLVPFLAQLAEMS